MKDCEQFRPIDTDTMIGNLLHQTEAVVEVHEASLAQGKRELLAWMAEQAPSDPAAASAEPRENGGEPCRQQRVGGQIVTANAPSMR